MARRCFPRSRHSPSTPWSSTCTCPAAAAWKCSNRRTPFIVLTADATPEARAECERAGAFAYLTKPVVVDRLLGRLAEIAEGVSPAGAAKEAQPADAGMADGSVISQHILDELREMG